MTVRSSLRLSSANDGNRGSPTHVRYFVVLSAALMAVLLYLDRFCISFAEIFIKEDLALTDDQIGWVLSAFFWTYALCQVPSGWLTDRFGARTMLTAYILLWSLFTGLTGAAAGFAMLLVVRLGFGIGQAGAYPTSAAVISKWVPFSGRGGASSIVAVGGRVGGALAPLLTGFLILLFVPASSSSLLGRRDVIDAPRLSYELLHGAFSTKSPRKADISGPAARLGKRIVPQLSPSSREILLAASEYFAADTIERAIANKENREPAELLSRRVAPTGEEIDRLVQDLNQAVLQQSDFFSADELHDLSLEKEAQQLLKRDRSQCSQTEVERLNRLVLEATYRQSIRKVYGGGWRQVMCIFGLAGLIVAALFWWAARNTPRQHPNCNDAEVALIEEGRPPTARVSRGEVRGVPLRHIVRSPSLWLSSLSQFFTNVGWVFIVTWFPRYLENVYHEPVARRVWMVLIPMTVGWFGMLSGGRLTDWLVGVVGLRWGRALPMSLTRFAAMSAYVVCLFHWPSPWVAVAMMSVVALFTDMGTSASWAFAQDVGGRHVGSILGWGNMWGNLGAAVATKFLLWIVGIDYNWNAAFITCAIAFLISGIAASGINATRPVVPESGTE